MQHSHFDHCVVVQTETIKPAEYILEIFLLLDLHPPRSQNQAAYLILSMYDFCM